MRRLSVFVAFLFTFFFAFPALWAQAPSGIPYQAVARNSSGNLIAGQNISVRFSIREGSASGSIAYRETHSTTTNGLGLFVVNIGQGTPVSGTFGGVNWGSSLKFMQVEMDAAGGSSYVDMGTQQMLSVPYALYANSGGTPPAAGAGISVSGNTVTNIAPDQTVTLTGSGATTVTGTYPNFTVSSTDANTTYTGGSGINISGTTIHNTAPDQTVTLTGNGATTVTGTYPNFTVSSTDANTTYTGGTGIDVNGTTINNTAPDQIVTLTGEGAIEVTGTYPNFTVSSTDANTTYTGGAGIDVTGTTITNTAPDQPVTLTGEGIISVEGDYPDFTIVASEEDPKVGTLEENYVPKWNGSELTNGLIYNTDDRIGVNTTNPGGLGGDLTYPMLEIWSEDEDMVDINTVLFANTSASPWINTGKARGSIAAPQAVEAGDNLLQLNAHAYNGEEFMSVAGMVMSVEEDAESGIPTQITFLTTNAESDYPEERAVIDSRGNVGIGLSNPLDKLHVDGNIRIENHQLYLREDDDVHHGLGYFGAHGNQLWDDYDVDGPVLYGYSGGALGVTDAEDDEKIVLRWQSEGKVGINTPDPEVELDVNGRINLSQDLYMGNNRVLSIAGTDNVFFGRNTGAANTMGNSNAFVGSNAGSHNTTGDVNVFMGHNAGESNTEGNGNVFMGYSAGKGNVSGDYNIYLGRAAAYSNATGIWNVAIGLQAMYNNTSGEYNVVIGGNVANNNTTGSRNTMIGTEAGYNSAGSNNVFIGNQAGYSETGNNKLYIDNSGTSNPLIWGDFNTNVLAVNGNMGIGTTSVTQAKLVVNGSQNINLSYGYLNGSGDTGESSGNNAYSIYASNRIAAAEFNAFSDARIKNILGVSNSRSDLQTLMQLEITNYKLKDHFAKGTAEYKKVIAQQVEQVYPQAVTQMTDVVPDIYQLAAIHDGYIALKNTLKAGDKVRLIFGERTELVAVLEANAQGFKVELSDEGKVFVYGREVNDFRTVDYEALSMLNISATQELVKMIAAQQATIDAQNKSIEGLKTAQAVLQSENQTMKSDIGQIKAALKLNEQAGLVKD